jgi:hypothetical protein
MEKSIEKLFSDFITQSGIEIPQNILSNYKNGENNNSDFVRLFKLNFDSVQKLNPELRILISESFVLEILNLINKFPKQNRFDILFQELENYDNFYNGKKMQIDLDTKKLLTEDLLYYVNDYNYNDNRFKFPLIQKAYENLDSNPEVMKVILILYADCGGEGGIIVRGKNHGFDTGYLHDEFSTIEFEGTIVEYDGYTKQSYERLHKVVILNLK